MQGDFGTTVTGQPVSAELGRRIGVSLRLLVIGGVLGATLRVLVGAWSAVRQYRLSDRLITAVSLLILSAPTFVIASLLILGGNKVNSVLGVRLFEYIGETSPDAIGGVWDQFVDRMQHLVLPTTTLALGCDRRLQPLPAQRHARRCSAGTSSAPRARASPGGRRCSSTACAPP